MSVSPTVSSPMEGLREEKGAMPKRKDALYRELGRFVYEQNPYKESAKLPSNFKSKQVKNAGPGRSKNQKNPFKKADAFRFPPKEREKEILKGLFWYFGDDGKGKVYRVCKAIKMPYHHGHSLLIGYEGGGGH